MKPTPPDSVRRHLAPSLRVALVATLVVIVVYAGAVTLLDVLVAHRLVTQVDRQLTSRLEAARRRPPDDATEEPDSPGGGIHYGVGIYGEPIYVWEVRSRSRTAEPDKEAPHLPALAWPAEGAGSVTRNLSGTDFRLMSVGYRGGLLVAGESLSELSHVESVLITSELVAAPVLLVAIFLASLFIGLRAARPIELARRRQLEFTADASHELRTPLSVIEAELSLARGPDAVPDPGVLDRIAGESGRLKRIVDDLLWLARFDAAPPPPGSETVDVVTVAEACVERFSVVASSRSIDLGLERLGSAPATIVAPADWIDRLAAVLVDNACKYAGQGGAVLIEVGRVGPRVVLAVEDTGPGIPAGERKALFDRFKRGTDQAGGHGLGLAIADSVVRSTGGRWRPGDARPGLGGARMEVSWPSQRAPI